MELKTQALERVLEALSPALTAELDRVVQETRDALEQEFQERLQAAVREAEAAARATAQVEIERAITELRSVATIEAEIQRAQPSAAVVWRQTAGCSDITLAASAAACAEILKLRQALGAAQRRDTVDAGLRNAEARLAALPAITTGDPQAAMAADILVWASAGYVSLTPHDIHRLRITGLTIIPALAGIIFMFAVMLLLVGKKRGKPVAGA